MCLDLSVQSTADRLSRFLKSLGADLVLDLKLAEDWSILELQREMVERRRAREQEGPNPKNRHDSDLSIEKERKTWLPK